MQCVSQPLCMQPRVNCGEEQRRSAALRCCDLTRSARCVVVDLMAVQHSRVEQWRRIGPRVYTNEPTDCKGRVTLRLDRCISASPDATINLTADSDSPRQNHYVGAVRAGQESWETCGGYSITEISTTANHGAQRVETGERRCARGHVQPHSCVSTGEMQVLHHPRTVDKTAAKQAGTGPPHRCAVHRREWGTAVVGCILLISLLGAKAG